MEAATSTANNEAADKAAEGFGFQMGTSPFSMELSQDQQDIRDWAHGFAEKVVRPAAHEWDEKEEFPWPIVQEAAKIGLYGFESHRPVLGRPVRPHVPDRQRGALLGRRRDRHVDLRHHPRRRRHLRSGTPRADGRVGTAVLRHRGRRQGRRLLRLRAGRRLRRLRLSAPPRSTTRPTDEWVINGQKAWATNGGIANVHVVIASVDRELGSRGHAGFVIPPGHEGLRAGREGEEARHPRLHTADVHLDDCRIPGSCLLGGKEKLDEKLARAREGKKRQGPGGDADLRALAPDGRLAGGRASPAPPTSTRSTTPRSASSSAARSSRTRRSRSRSPT